MKIIIKNGHILDPASATDGIRDILVEDGKIAKVEADIKDAADQTIDASGLMVMPGFIDLHVHFREPGFEYKETIKSGSIAAARGGFTSVCPMPNTKPVIDCVEWINWLKEKEKTDSVVHLIPVGSVTIGQAGEQVIDLEAMAEAGMKAISEDGKSVMNTRIYREAMKRAEKAGIVILAHCEDRELVEGGVLNAGIKAEELGVPGISNSVEDVIVARDILLAKETGVKLHLCHCSTRDSVSLIQWGKEQGVRVSGEVCPHHFALTDEDIPGDDANYKMNPPLRQRADADALKAGLRDNIMEAISTDHAPHSQEEKARPVKKSPFGIVGLETAFSLAVTELVEMGYLTPMQLAERMSRQPAEIIGIDKGSLEPGKAADITIVDLNEEYVIDASKFASKGKNTPFHGKKVKGRVHMTMVDGTIVYDLKQEMHSGS